MLKNTDCLSPLVAWRLDGLTVTCGTSWCRLETGDGCTLLVRGRRELSLLLGFMRDTLSEDGCVDGLRTNASLGGCDVDLLTVASERYLYVANDKGRAGYFATLSESFIQDLCAWLDYCLHGSQACTDDRDLLEVQHDASALSLALHPACGVHDVRLAMSGARARAFIDALLFAAAGGDAPGIQTDCGDERIDLTPSCPVNFSFVVRLGSSAMPTLTLTRSSLVMLARECAGAPPFKAAI